MGGSKKSLLVVLLMVISAAAATPPGIANNPSHASCKDPKYKHCYNLVHVCPIFCPGGCTVECSSCKPICIGTGPTLPPQGGNNNKYPPYSPPPTPSSPSPPKNTPSSPSPPNTTPSSPSPPNNTPSSPSPSPPNPSPPNNTPSSPSPSPPNTIPSSPSPLDNIPSSPSLSPPITTPSSPSPPDNTPSSPSPPNNTPSSPSPPNKTPSSPSPPDDTPSSPSPPDNTPSSPSPPDTTPSSPSPPNNTPSSPSPPNTTPSSPSPSDNTPSSPSPPNTTPSSPSPPSSPTPTPTPPSTPPSPKMAKCKRKYYPQCYNTEHVCLSTCPGGCYVDCITCKPVCKCDRPGAVCQDPRFIGGDGITFYFHGKKDHDFCLVSDPNLHINAHFIGKRNEKMTRDFTWVQSIAILFNKHKIFIGALKTAIWEDSIDRLALSIDGQPLTLPENEGSTWQYKTEQAGISVTRISDTNNIKVEVEGKFKITAKVVPITEQDSKIHNYGITKDDCFAHLDLGFKFYSLTDQVNGVLGQTYRPGYVSRVNVGVKMPVMGGHKEFKTSNIFAADCSVARFNGFDGNMQNLELPSLSCASGIDGQGVVCKR